MPVELSFPADAELGQIYSEVGSPVYQFNGYAWNCIGLTATVPPSNFYNYNFSHGSIDPVDSTTYYIGDFPDLQPSSTISNSFGIVSQVNGVIDSLSHTIAIVGATSDSSEHSIIEIHNITQGSSVTVANEVHHSLSGAQYNYTDFSLSVSQDDIIQIRWITPIWIINPTQVRQRFTLKITNL
jgi:hypothetical protein